MQEHYWLPLDWQPITWNAKVSISRNSYIKKAAIFQHTVYVQLWVFETLLYLAKAGM